LGSPLSNYAASFGIISHSHTHTHTGKSDYTLACERRRFPFLSSFRRKKWKKPPRLKKIRKQQKILFFFKFLNEERTWVYIGDIVAAVVINTFASYTQHIRVYTNTISSELDY
jgi:hypothetical protein